MFESANLLQQILPSLSERTGMSGFTECNDFTLHSSQRGSTPVAEAAFSTTPAYKNQQP
jgi:hypothetical protein